MGKGGGEGGRGRARVCVACLHATLFILGPVLLIILISFFSFQIRKPTFVHSFSLHVSDPGFDSRLRHGDFSGSSHTDDLKIAIPVATLSGPWRYRVSAGTGWPGVSIL